MYTTSNHLAQYSTSGHGVILGKEVFDNLKRKQNLTVWDKKSILLGILTLGWEVEYPSFKPEELMSIVSKYSEIMMMPKIKMKGKIIIVINARIGRMRGFNDLRSAISYVANSYNNYTHCAILDLDPETLTYKFQEVLECKPGIETELIKRFPVQTLGSKTCEEILDRINELVMKMSATSKILNYSSGPTINTTSRNNYGKRICP